jgi:hypothetical protein
MTKPRIRMPGSGIALAWLLLASFSGVMASRAAPLPNSYPIPLTRTWTFDVDPDREVPSYDFGADLRVRYTDLDNVNALGAGVDPHRRFFRIRTRLRGDVWLSPGWRVFAELANESRSYLECGMCKSRFGEVIFDNLFFEFTNQEGNPLGLRIGRQDLFYGDGFIICDGTPLDGSRTLYTNGVLLTTAIPGWSFDAFTVWNRKKDEWLPRINNAYTPLLEYNGFVGGLYLRGFEPGGEPKSYTLDYYYVFAEEEGPGRHAGINTFGLRGTATLGPVWLTAEIAYQGGREPESRFIVADPSLAGAQTITAYGGQAKLATPAPGGIPADAAVGYVQLSGDDPLTRNKFEGWNPIMGRWPQWSELYIYTLGMAAAVQPMGQGVAFWQNLRAPYVELLLLPQASVVLEARATWMLADTSVPLSLETPPGSVVGASRDRGSLLTFRVSWNPENLPLEGHILYERFDPGAYYPSGAKTADFLRFQITAGI